HDRQVRGRDQDRSGGPAPDIGAGNGVSGQPARRPSVPDPGARNGGGERHLPGSDGRPAGGADVMTARIARASFALLLLAGCAGAGSLDPSGTAGTTGTAGSGNPGAAGSGNPGVAGVGNP